MQAATSYAMPDPTTVALDWDYTHDGRYEIQTHLRENPSGMKTGWYYTIRIQKLGLRSSDAQIKYHGPFTTDEGAVAEASYASRRWLRTYNNPSLTLQAIQEIT